MSDLENKLNAIYKYLNETNNCYIPECGSDFCILADPNGWDTDGSDCKHRLECIRLYREEQAFKELKKAFDNG